MFKQPLLGLLSVISLGVLTACSSTPYAPVAAQVPPVDTTAFAPKVESFVVLLDTSGSMKDVDDGRPKIQSAEDLVASFNSAVPAANFQAGLVIFGRGAGTCWGYGAADTLYGLTSYDAADFASALGSIKCAASTTPIADAVGSATGMLADQEGPTAVIIVSDFVWSDPDAVKAAVADLKNHHGNKICLHTVKVGYDTTGDALISSLNDTASCDSAVAAADIASGAGMSAYVAATLMSPLEYEKHTVSATTLFDFDKAVLKEQGKAALQEVGANIRSKGLTVADIDIIGYTDNIGTQSYNQELSERRAAAVRNYLVSEGVNAGIVDVMGRGMNDPVASNDTEAGRAANRRVEVHVGTSQLLK